MIPKPCLGCRKPTTRPGSRCSNCAPAWTRQRDQRRGTVVERGYDSEYQKARAAVIRAQPWCSAPGCMHPGSPDNPLTADHVVSLALGGTNDLANLRTMCRFHNSQRGAG